MKPTSSNHRRSYLHFATLFACSAALATGADRQRDPTTFTWNPELSQSGPVLVTVSLKSQTAAVYRNGIKIGACEISAGRKGHETPTGVFHILNKDAHHRSKTYGNAPMPYSERLTWDGVALHAGALPGYPSSHGCIHLPYDFSQKLFGITHKGTSAFIFSGWKVDGRGQTAESHWHQVGGAKSNHDATLDEWFKLDPRFQHILQALLVPGTNLVVTSESVTHETRSAPGFTVLQGRREEVAEKG